MEETPLASYLGSLPDFPNPVCTEEKPSIGVLHSPQVDAPSPRVQRSVLGPSPPHPWSLTFCEPLDPSPTVMKGERGYLFLSITTKLSCYSI